MGLVRLIRMVGLVMLGLGIIVFVLPGQFLYSPEIETSLVTVGNSLFPGISSNPVVHTLIVKAPAVLLIITGGCLALAGFLSDPGKPEEASRGTEGTRRRDVEDLIRRYGPDEKKYDYPGTWGKEPAGRKKP